MKLVFVIGIALAAVSLSALRYHSERSEALLALASTPLTIDRKPTAHQVLADWEEAFKVVMSEHAGQGACEPSVVYHWTGPTPINIPIIQHEVATGEIFETVDPVAYALLLSDSRWAVSLRLDGSMFQHSGVPTGCTATLKQVVGQGHLSFSCNQDCGSLISCEPSNVIRNEGYCSCAGGPAPSTCHGDFTRSSPSSWNISCTTGPCVVGQTCSFDFAIINGIETWWCACQ